MKLQTRQGEVVASIDLNASGSTLAPRVALMPTGTQFAAPEIAISTERSGDGLVLHSDVPGYEIDVLLEMGDIKALKGLMSKGVIGFVVKALM